MSVFRRTVNKLVLVGLALTGCYFMLELALRFYKDYDKVFKYSETIIATALTMTGILVLAALIVKLTEKGLCRAGQRQYSERNVLLFVLALALLPRLLLLLTVPIAPSSDFEWYYKNAMSLAETGQFPVSNYIIAVAPNAFVYISILAPILKISNGSVLAGLLLNLAFFVGAALFFYKSLRLITDIKYAALGAVLFCLDPNNILYSLELATEPFALLFLMCGLYLFLKFESEDTAGARRFVYGALSGASLALSNNIRPNAVIFLIAIVIYFALWFKKKKLLPVLLMLAVFFLTSAMFKALQEQAFGVKLGINYGWTLFEGLDINTFGLWNQKNTDVLGEVMSAYPPEQVQAVMLEKAIERVRDYDLITWLKLFAGKGIFTWVYSNYAYMAEELTGFRNIFGGALNFIHIMELAVFSLLSLRFAFNNRNRTFEARIAVFYVPVVGMIIVHSFATSIPRYQYLAMQFIFAAIVLMLKSAESTGESPQLK